MRGKGLNDGWRGWRRFLARICGIWGSGWNLSRMNLHMCAR